MIEFGIMALIHSLMFRKAKPRKSRNDDEFRQIGLLTLLGLRLSGEQGAIRY